MLVPSTLYVIIEHVPRPQENNKDCPGRNKASPGIMVAQQIRRERERGEHRLFSPLPMVLAMHRPQRICQFYTA